MGVARSFTVSRSAGKTSMPVISTPKLPIRGRVSSCSEVAAVDPMDTSDYRVPRKLRAHRLMVFLPCLSCYPQRRQTDDHHRLRRWTLFLAIADAQLCRRHPQAVCPADAHI